MDNEYKIATLLDIAELENDQIDRLCAELPSVLKHAKALMGLLGAVGMAMGEKGPVAEILTPLTWIDDGKTDITARMMHGDEEVMNFKTTKGEQ